MISKSAVEEQLKRIGFSFRFWGRSEVNELGKILLEDEIIAECVNGEYTNGFALLVATNHRVLVVDKKPMLYLTVEDLRFDMITEFNLSHRVLNATINIYTANKTLTFTSWNQQRLRRLLEYTQQRVLEMRQQAHMAQQFQAAAAAQYAQLHAANYYSYGQAQQPVGYAPNLMEQQPQQRAMTPEQHFSASSAAAQASAVQPAPQAAPAAESGIENQQSLQPHTIVSRFAAKRAALGTYTRSKLPSFRHHHDRQDKAMPARTDEISGEVYPQGYIPGQPVTNFGLPYEY